MTRFVTLIDGKPGAYGVVVPDAPGCTAMGRTIDEALTHAIEALSEWMSDRVGAGFDAIQPRPVEAIRSDPEVMAELEAGSLVASIPLLLDHGRSVQANLSIDAGLLASIDDAARARGITRSAFMASAARDKILADT